MELNVIPGQPPSYNLGRKVGGTLIRVFVAFRKEVYKVSQKLKYDKWVRKPWPGGAAGRSVVLFAKGRVREANDRCFSLTSLTSVFLSLSPFFPSLSQIDNVALGEV